ncbi:hypothetical protein V2G26_020410 [Clonostachys chloroleuca]
MATSLATSGDLGRIKRFDHVRHNMHTYLYALASNGLRHSRQTPAMGFLTLIQSMSHANRSEIRFLFHNLLCNIVARRSERAGDFVALEPGNSCRRRLLPSY